MADLPHREDVRINEWVHIKRHLKVNAKKRNKIRESNTGNMMEASKVEGDVQKKIKFRIQI